MGSDGERSSVGGDLLSQAIAHDGAHWHQARIGDGVEGRRAIGASRDDAGVVQHPEMLRHVCLARAQSVDQLADVLLAVVEQRTDDPESRRVAEYTKTFGDVFEEFGGQGLRHAEHYITMER